jgi:hypothetical protein
LAEFRELREQVAFHVVCTAEGTLFPGAER